MLNFTKLVSVSEMRVVEKEANEKGLSYHQMMENAGKNLGKIINEQYISLRDQGIIGLIGSGNNGGDALVALHYLAERGWSAAAYIVKQRLPDDPLIMFLLKSKGKIFTYEGDQDLNILESQLHQHRIILDGIFGTGVKLPLKEDVNSVIAKTNTFVQNWEKEDRKIVIAVDCPSGVDCDTGEINHEVINADLTITMAAIKEGLFRFPASEKVGTICVADIGLTDAYQAWSSIKRFVVEENWIKAKLIKRPKNSHKGTFGNALIIAGSLNYTGAALLAGKAAYLAGTGLVTMAIPKPLHQALAGQFPEGTWVLLDHEEGFISHDAYRDLSEYIKYASSLLIGPGLGKKYSTKLFLETLLRNKNDLDLKDLSISQNYNLPPLVIDADGLKLLAQIEDWYELLPSETILTPHPGEMAVLTGLSIDEIQKDRFQVALNYAKKWRKIIILKGAYTIIAAADGQGAIIPVATSALARAGTGDVLAGLIVGLRAQGMNAYEAAVTGAWIHGQAGIIAEKKFGSSISILASDILHSIVDVFRQLNS
jgi:hydroxyethylthiazole kinase-like uncharacterized protein yjeF